jgi:small neutral amino acid transporter SnatA (MarC family)
VITAVLALLVAVNPAAASSTLARDWRTDRPMPVLAGTVVAGVVLVALAGFADPILDALDVNLGTFRLGAGVVLLVAGLRWMAVGPPASAAEPVNDARLGGFVFFPTLLTPAAAVVAVSAGAEEGVAVTAAAIAVAVLAGGVGVYLRRRIPELVVNGLVRLLGGGAIVAGIVIAVDGVRTL